MRNLRTITLLIVFTILIAACSLPGPVESTSVPTPLVIVGPEEKRPLTLQPQPGEIAENYPLPLDGKLVVAPTGALIMTILVENETGAFVSFRVFRPMVNSDVEVHFTVISKANLPWTVHRVKFTQWPDKTAIVEVLDEMMTLVDQSGLVGCLSPPCNTGEWNIEDVIEGHSYEIE